MPKTKTDIDQLLRETLHGKEDIRRVLQRFISKELVNTTGLVIIWTRENTVDIDGSHFSEPEITWALEKAKQKVLNKLITFG